MMMCLNTPSPPPFRADSHHRSYRITAASLAAMLFLHLCPLAHTAQQQLPYHTNIPFPALVLVLVSPVWEPLYRHAGHRRQGAVYGVGAVILGLAGAIDHPTTASLEERSAHLSTRHTFFASTFDHALVRRVQTFVADLEEAKYTQGLGGALVRRAGEQLVLSFGVWEVNDR